MSDNRVIKESNGFCVTTDTNFANKKTCEDFFNLLHQQIKEEPTLKNLVAAENSSRFETNILPMGLRDLSQIISESTTHRENYAEMRAELEMRMFAGKYYTEGSDLEFYTSYLKSAIENTKNRFSGGVNGKVVNVVSQISFSRLSQVMVNLLLMKKADGTDNIIRRRKAKPNSETINEDGTISYEYYSNEEINAAEVQLYNERSAHNFIQLDVGYVPFTDSYLLLSVASMINAKRSTVNADDKTTFEEIFETGDDFSTLINEQFVEIAKIAKRDLDIIDIVESRGASIIELIHADTKGVDPVPMSGNSLSMKEVYMTLLQHVKLAIIMSAGLIERIRKYGATIGITKSAIEKIIGIDTSKYHGEDGFMEEFEAILTSKNFAKYVGELPFRFQVNDHLFRFLMVNLVKRATVGYGINVTPILNRFTEYISYRSSRSEIISPIIEKFFKYLHNVVDEKPVLFVTGMISVVDGNKEPMESYAYRTLSKYTKSDGRFTMELALLDSTIKIIKNRTAERKVEVRRYDIFDNEYIFSLDTLIETVKRITGDQALSETIQPFKIYKEELNNKISALEKRRKEVDDQLDEVFGKSFPQFYVKLPPIPYDFNEIQWLKMKCMTLAAEIENITSNYSTFDWSGFRETYRNLTRVTDDFAVSEIEDPDMVAEIAKYQQLYDDYASKCGLDDSYLHKYKSLEKDLNYYSNPDKIKFEFKKFKFDFNKGVGLKMSFNLGKTSIIYQDVIRTVQSLMIDPNLFSILDTYFRPFFEGFATINVDAFDIKFDSVTRVVSKSKFGIAPTTATVNDVIMTVTFGSTEDTHVCSKFRHYFYSIKDNQRLFMEAKKQLGIPLEKSDFSYNDIPENFVIRWQRSSDQNVALSGQLGEKTYKIYNEARGCNENYPFYDSLGARIVREEFNKVNEKYRSVLDSRERIAREKREKQEREERRLKGIVDEPALKFGEQSAAGAALIERSRNKWLARDSEGVEVNLVDTIRNVTEGTQPVVSGDARQLPYGGQKIGRQGGYQRHGYQSGQSSERNDGRLTISNQQPNEIAQNFVRYKNRRGVENGDDGWKRITYERKTIQGYIRKQGGTPALSGRDSENSRARNSKTPTRFVNGLRGGNRSKSSERPPYGGRRSTPTFSGSRGTPISISSHEGTPSSQNRSFNSASPSADKRSGYQGGVQSPSEGNYYFQPNHNGFTESSVSNSLGFYPSNPASSPFVSTGESLFENIEPPTGVFTAVRTTPYEDRVGTDKSQKSVESNYTAPVAQVFAAPVEDDEF